MLQVFRDRSVLMARKADKVHQDLLVFVVIQVNRDLLDLLATPETLVDLDCRDSLDRSAPEVQMEHLD